MGQKEFRRLRPGELQMQCLDRPYRPDFVAWVQHDRFGSPEAVDLERGAGATSDTLIFLLSHATDLLSREGSRFVRRDSCAHSLFLSK